MGKQNVDFGATDLWFINNSLLAVMIGMVIGASRQDGTVLSVLNGVVLAVLLVGYAATLLSLSRAKRGTVVIGQQLIVLAVMLVLALVVPSPWYKLALLLALVALIAVNVWRPKRHR